LAAVCIDLGGCSRRKLGKVTIVLRVLRIICPFGPPYIFSLSNYGMSQVFIGGGRSCPIRVITAAAPALSNHKATRSEIRFSPSLAEAEMECGCYFGTLKHARSLE
jgi:hypothetical protein